MSQVEFLFGLLGLLSGIIVAVPVGYVLFQTKSGCRAMHAEAKTDDSLVLVKLAGMETRLEDWTRKSDESRRIMFAMIRALISRIEMSPDERERILNMQG